MGRGEQGVFVLGSSFPQSLSQPSTCEEGSCRRRLAASPFRATLLGHVAIVLISKALPSREAALGGAHGQESRTS